MAKIPFSKLQASVNAVDTKLSYCNKAGEEIIYEVKTYLPMKDKMALVSTIINKSIDDNGFYNPMLVKVNTVLEVVYAYTNLSFTDKMKEDSYKLYDILVSTGIFNNVVSAISGNDWKEIQEDTIAVIENVYKYKNSLVGVLDTLKTDYSSLEFDASAIQSQLADPENMQLVKDVLSKLA